MKSQSLGLRGFQILPLAKYECRPLPTRYVLRRRPRSWSCLALCRLLQPETRCVECACLARLISAFVCAGVLSVLPCAAPRPDGSMLHVCGTSCVWAMHSHLPCWGTPVPSRHVCWWRHVAPFYIEKHAAASGLATMLRLFPNRAK